MGYFVQGYDLGELRLTMANYFRFYGHLEGSTLLKSGLGHLVWCDAFFFFFGFPINFNGVAIWIFHTVDKLELF